MRAVAVIGAGVSGLACARALQAAGHRVTLFDKSRGPGGRCATRRNAAGAFDHGAPHFGAQTEAFRAELARWVEAGWVQPDAALRGHWVGVPSMNRLAGHVAEGLSLRTEHPVAAIEAQPAGGWSLRCHDGGSAAGAFDTVVVALPAEQAAALLAPAPTLAEAMRGVHSEPTWTVMAAWPQPLPLAAARVEPAVGPLALALRDDAKPRRPSIPGAGTRWVLHAQAEWSAHNLDVPAEQIIRCLLDALAETAGLRLARPSHAVAQRWRYAQVPRPHAEPCGWDPTSRIGSCGDAWHALGGDAPGRHGIERAWLSGQALAARIGAA